MEIQQHGQQLNIRGLRELCAANSRSIRDALCAAVSPGISTIEVDLSQLSFVDGCGLGALAALHKSANQQDSTVNPVVRLLNPQPAVQQVIELTRMHHLFEIVTRNDDETGDAATVAMNSAAFPSELNGAAAPLAA
jgi:anti-sigma B factor antagonist